MKRMKRLAALLLVLCLLVFPAPAQAAGESDLVFELNSDGESYCVADCNDSASGSLEIPASFNGKPVAGIGDWAFYDCGDLTNITIPEGVKTIGYAAFWGCTSMCSIKIPSSVTSIGENVFNSCVALTGVWVDDKNTCYSNDQSGVLFNKNKTILIYAPHELEGNYEIPESVISIEDAAFYNCYLLENVNVSKNVKDIGIEAFAACYSLEGIWVNENNPNYSSDSYGVLFNKDKTVLITATTSVRADYTILESVEELGDKAFYNCDRLVDVEISEKITYIGAEAFTSCYGLNGIWVDENNPNYSSDSYGVLFNKDKTVLITATKGINDSYTIPDSVITIGAYAFENRWSLTSITIPLNLTRIEGNAFLWCSELTDIHYYGTEEQRERIDIEWGNDDLINANWKYMVGGPVFSDVGSTNWQHTAAKYAIENGLMAGKGTDQYGRIVFDPNNSITRAEFVQVLYNAESKPSVSIANKFPDVKNEWYKDAVLWANSQNIANGMGDGNFGVSKNITRQDLALMLYKYAKLKGADLTATAGKSGQYADGSKVSGYARQAMDWAVTQGVMSGKGASGAPASQLRLDPAGTATRAECAAMLKNFMESQDDPVAPEEPDTPAMTAVLTGVEADSIQYYNCKESGNFAVIEKDGKYGIIGYDGNLILPISYNNIYRGRGFSYDFLLIAENEDDWGSYIDKDGKIAYGYPDGGGLEPVAYWYNGQLAVFMIGEGIIGGLEELSWIDVEQRSWKDNAVLPVQEMTGITENEWGVKFPKIENRNYALMDVTTGQLVSDFVYSAFDTGNGFSEGILAVKKGDKWGFIDTNGNEITEFLYDPYEQNDDYEEVEYKYTIFTAANGYIAVLKDGKWGLIDTQGKTVVETAYDGISQVNPDGMFWLKENGSWTLYQLEQS